MPIIVRLLALLCALQTATPAFSENLQLQDYCLQPTHWYHSRPHVQILNSGPIVDDLRTAEERTVYNISVPPAPTSVIRNVNIDLADRTATRPGTLNLNKPGFTSNISPTTSRMRNLPPGPKTGSLPPLGSLVSNNASLKTKAQPLTKITPQEGPTTTAMSYKQESFTASSGNRVKLDAIGKLLK